MGTPAFSCSTDAHSNTLIVDSDDEVDQSSMWVQQENNPSSDLPPDFLEPLSPGVNVISTLLPFSHPTTRQEQQTHESRQFWKSGDFTGFRDGTSFATAGMDHARVHPKFLHSNATSHKWVLGAVAELLDNAVDEIRNGATFAKVDVQKNPRNGEPMLVIEDDGGGMDPDCMRRCMSLGYSAKSKLSNTIGQYGNGFKTSTMRLGADVIVFSRCGGRKPSESIGMMSYTFLTSTGQNDIIVPIVDFQIEAFGIRKLIRSNVDDWMESMEAIENWSPYSSQSELVNQFKSIPRHQGTKIVIYNLWEDEEGHLELDFAADPHDIQIRSTSRDERTLKLAARYASCRHYLTYKHSLRIYLSILYLRLPTTFRIFLRGKQVQHYSLQNAMMIVEQVTYKPKDARNAKAVVTIGFVKDAGEHIDVSGFNVYHKNRLIKPFWRIWNSSDTRGRGVIAILEANFVEPAHDKQGFERTIVLTRLEARLIEMQKSYFNKHCHKIGYTNASMRRTVRPPPQDNNSSASGGINSSPANGNATKHAEAKLPVTKRSVAAVQYGGVTSAISHVKDIPPAVMTQTMRETLSNPSIVEVQEQNVVLRCIDSVATGLGNNNGIMLHRQELVQGEQCVQDPPLPSVQRDLQMSFPPISSDVTNSHVQSTCLSSTDLNSQDVRSQFSTGIAPVVIDLDSPEVDEKFEDVAFEVSFPPSCDVKKEIAEEVDLESVFLLGAGNTCETALQGDDMAGSPKENDGEGHTDPSLRLLPSGEMKDLPGSIGLESCFVADETGTDQVEAALQEHSMESSGQSDDLIVPAIKGCLAAPITIFKDGQNDEHKTLGKAVLEKGNMEIPSSATCSEPQIPTAMELDDFFDSLAPQNEAPSHTPLSIKETEALAQSHNDLIEPNITEKSTPDSLGPQNEAPSHTPLSIKETEALTQSHNDLIEPNITEKSTPDNGHVPFSTSIEILGVNASTVSTKWSEGASKEQGIRDINKSEVFSEDAMNGCNEAQTDMDAVRIDAEGKKGEDYPKPKEDFVNDDGKPVSAVTLVVVPHIPTDQKDSFGSKAQTAIDVVMMDAEGQEGEDCPKPKKDFVNDDEKAVSAVMGQPTNKNLDVVSYIPTNAMDSFGSKSQTDMDAVRTDAERHESADCPKPKEGFVNNDEKPFSAVMGQPTSKDLAVVSHIPTDPKDSFGSRTQTDVDAVWINAERQEGGDCPKPNKDFVNGDEKPVSAVAHTPTDQNDSFDSKAQIDIDAVRIDAEGQEGGDCPKPEEDFVNDDGKPISAVMGQPTIKDLAVVSHIPTDPKDSFGGKAQTDIDAERTDVERQEGENCPKPKEDFKKDDEKPVSAVIGQPTNKDLAVVPHISKGSFGSKVQTDMDGVMIDAEGQECRDCPKRKDDFVSDDEKPISEVMEQPANKDLAVIPHPTDPKDSFGSNPRADMDAVMIDAEGQEGVDCPKPKEDFVSDDEKPVSVVMEQPANKDLAVTPHIPTDPKDSFGSKAQTDMDAVTKDAKGQEGEDCPKPKEDFVNDDEKPNSAVMEQLAKKDLAVMPHIPRDQKDSFVGNKVQTDMDAVPIDVEGQEGGDCPNPKEDFVNVGAKSVSAVMEQLANKDLDVILHIPTDQSFGSKAQTDMDAVMIDVEGQESGDCPKPREDLWNDDEKPVLAVMEQPANKELAVIPHIPTDQKDSFGKTEASCQDIVCIPTATVVEVATAIQVASSSCIDVMDEDRLVLVKQQIEYLQHSIEAVEVEVDDLREQLEQHRELQLLDLRDLSMELERALSRLEEVQHIELRQLDNELERALSRLEELRG